MSTKKYRIRLTTDEQQELNALVSRGRAAAYKQTHARILLMSDESRSDGGRTLHQRARLGQSANTQALCGGGGRVCAESKSNCVGVKRD